MKHDVLRSVAHNIADSLASGICFMIGIYNIDVYEAARNSANGSITIDFLAGSACGEKISDDLAKALARYKEELPALCKKQGVSVEQFRKLSVTYSRVATGPRATVVVEDIDGKQSIDEYVGLPLQYPKIVDGLCRIRTKRH